MLTRVQEEINELAEDHGGEVEIGADFDHR